jgi:hypothetical protein
MVKVGAMMSRRPISDVANASSAPRQTARLAPGAAGPSIPTIAARIFEVLPPEIADGIVAPSTSAWCLLRALQRGAASFSPLRMALRL